VSSASDVILAPASVASWTCPPGRACCLLVRPDSVSRPRLPCIAGALRNGRGPGCAAGSLFRPEGLPVASRRLPRKRLGASGGSTFGSTTAGLAWSLRARFFASCQREESRTSAPGVIRLSATGLFRPVLAEAGGGTARTAHARRDLLHIFGTSRIDGTSWGGILAHGDGAGMVASGGAHACNSAITAEENSLPVDAERLVTGGGRSIATQTATP